MDNFTYFTPTKVVFGKGAECEAGQLIQSGGFKKVLIHYGGQSAKKSGLLHRVMASLDAAGIAYVELGGVVPNPRLSLVREGIAICKKEKVDFILAVGGGSVIDSAKAIGYGAVTEVDVWDIFNKKYVPIACMPIGAVLTLAAAGSEMSYSSVITNDEVEIWQKKGYSNDLSRCKFAIMNPELTATLPAYQTACGCVDIMMHTMERYFNQTKINSELTDGFCEVLLRTVMKNALILKENPSDYEARAEVMWAGSLSHNGLMSSGNDGGDWATHQLEHELSATFDVTHGAGLAAIWSSWARYVYKERPERFVKFALNVMQVKAGDNDEATIMAGIKAMEDFYHSLDMPVGLKELGIPEQTEEELAGLGYRCCYEGSRTVGKIMVLDATKCADIYRLAQF